MIRTSAHEPHNLLVLAAQIFDTYGIRVQSKTYTFVTAGIPKHMMTQ